MRTRTTWRDKLEKPGHPVIEEAPQRWTEQYGGSKMLIPTAKLVDAKLRTIPQGHLCTLGRLRALLAEDFDADFSCPLTTGIFFRIAAEASEEARGEHATARISPWWRVVGDDGALNPKLPGEGSWQATLLEEEGFAIAPKGRTKVMVKDYTKYLI